MIEPEYWGLPATAWTAISAVGTLGAVLVALGLPIWQAKARRRNLERVILRELVYNQRSLSVVVEPPANDVVPFVTGTPTRNELAWARLQNLYTAAWDRHRESVAELSYRRFIFYDDTNQMIELIRARALETEDLNQGGERLAFTVNLAKECIRFISKAPFWHQRSPVEGAKEARCKMIPLFHFLEGNGPGAKFFGAFVVVLIFLNIAAVILDSYAVLHAQYAVWFYAFEVFSVVVFTAEYVLRLITSPFLYGDSYEARHIVRYAFSPLAIIDLLAILPFFLPFLFSLDLRMIRIFRVFRLIRILKIKRYTKALDLLVDVLKSKKTELALVLTIILVLLLLCGATMYYIENEAQPELFPNIVEASLWSLKTMVFLGYDAPPVTAIGKFMGMFITLLGLAWIALPISIVSAGFVEQVSRTKEKGDQP